MSNKNKKKNKQTKAPTQEQQAKAQHAKQKKEFIKGLMKADRMVVFTGGMNVSRFGFASNGDFILFLLIEVFGFDGKNEMFQRIYQSLVNPQPAQEQEDDTDALLAEIEAEDGDETGDEGSSEGDGTKDEGEEGSSEEDEEDEADPEDKIIELQKRLEEAKKAAKKKPAKKEEDDEASKDE